MRNPDKSYLFNVLWQRRWRLVLAALIGLIAATVYLLVADKMYTVQLTAVPARYEDAMSADVGLSQALGGLGALAGIGNGYGDMTLEGLAILRSRSLVEEFISDRNLLPILFADKWDLSRSEWIDPDDIPSLWDGYRLFSERLLSVTEDLREGLIYVRITWTDSSVAAEWANELLRDANDRIRDDVVREASANINFLHDELEKTALLDLRQSIFSLIEVQIRKSMLANTRPDYAFKVIDPAQDKDPEAFDYPKAIILLPAGLIASTALYLLFVLAGIVFSSAELPRER